MSEDPVISKRSIRLAATVLILLFVGYSVWWWITARLFTRQIEGWIAQEQAKGATITPTNASVGGYPFAFVVVLDGTHLSWPAGFSVIAQHVRVRARPWSLGTIGIAATGGFGFAVPPGNTRPPLTIAGETLRGKIAFSNGALPSRISVTADTLSASRTVANEQSSAPREMTVATLELNSARPQTPAKSDADVGLDLSLHLVDLSAEALSANPLGVVIGDTLIQAKLMGPPPTSLDRAGLAAWRDAGGILEVPNLAIRWGPLGLAGKGTAALDSAMQPEAALTARLTGYEKAIDALVEAGWIKRNAAGLVKIALGLAAKPGPDGNPTAEVPVTIQNNGIFLGPAKLGEIPKINLD